METITPEGLKQLLEQQRDIALIDVREPWEFDLCRIEGSENIPMSEIMGKIDKLDKSSETVVLCHHGMRSLQIAEFLENAGFKSVFNLGGGIDAWASEVEPGMTRY